MSTFDGPSVDMIAADHFDGQAPFRSIEAGVTWFRGTDEGSTFQHLSHNEEIVRRVESYGESCLRDVYGGKGSGLIYMSYLGVPTRDAFIIPTEVARQGLHRTQRKRLEREVRHQTDPPEGGTHTASSPGVAQVGAEHPHRLFSEFPPESGRVEPEQKPSHAVHVRP